MSAQKNTPARGPITVVKNLTAAEINSSLDAGFDWVSEPDDDRSTGGAAYSER